MILISGLNFLCCYGGDHVLVNDLFIVMINRKVVKVNVKMI